MPYFSLLLLFCFFSCSTNNPLRNVEEYKGPIIEIKDLNTLYSDSAQAKFKLKSEIYQVFESGEEKYPKGLYMDIFSTDNDLGY